MNTQQLSRGLGWFSIGLGLAELLAPKKLGETIGVQDHQQTFQLMGLREIGAGIAILAQENPSAGSLWARVAGDAVDLGLLTAALKAKNSDRTRVRNAIIAVAGVTALDVLCGVYQGRAATQSRQRTSVYRGETRNRVGERSGARSGTPVRTSITINKPAEEIYGFWRNLENLPRFMSHLKAVTPIDEKRSHWVAKGPAGTEVEWDAEIIEEKPGELIAWRSLPGATVENAGSVRLQPATGGRGTVLRVNLRYRPPAGVVGATIAKLFGEAPEKQIPFDLLRVKQLLETGEIARTEGQPSGRAKSTSTVFDDYVRT